MKFNEGYKNIKVKLINSAGDNLAKYVYDFGRLSHDYNEVLPEKYDENNPDCIKLIDKIIEGTTLPKYALQGHRLDFRIEGISRICLAQITRDPAYFASASTGVYPLTQEFNIPLSICKEKDIMEKLIEAQKILEEAYIMCAEREIPSIEARYIGLHCQVISLTASYTPVDFVRSCFSRTSSNFCDECNYVYRKMLYEVVNMIVNCKDKNSIKLWKWLISYEKCINDKIYKRERLYNSDFTNLGKPVNDKKALNDWRKSGWKLELERMSKEEPELLTENEISLIRFWQGLNKLESTYDENNPEVLKNSIKQMDYYKEHRNA